MVDVNELVIQQVADRQNFLVDAGAGAGKTTTLVNAMTRLMAQSADDLAAKGQQIVCITYTNVAANEIMSRINNDPLVRVSTIHEFLWHLIEPFQSELKTEVYTLASESDKPEYADLDLSDLRIEYWQYPRKYAKGKLGHDDVIAISERLFSKYPKIAILVADKFPTIFVDEYQDTSPKTISLLLDHLAGNAAGRISIGLFGDYMQKIYNTGVGYVDHASLKRIQKTENYRCPVAVISLLNKLRPELQQAPGPKNVAGDARFFTSNGDSEDSFTKVWALLKSEGWEDESSKILMLTRKGIAGIQSWDGLLAVYQRRSSFGSDNLMAREDEFGQLFADIEQLCSAYTSGEFGKFLDVYAESGTRIERHSQKLELADSLDSLNRLRHSSSIGEVLDYVFQQNLLRKPKKLAALEKSIENPVDPVKTAKDSVFLSELRDTEYSQVIEFEKYLNNETPFSTNHGVKGEQYDNVLVVIDDKLWNQYKFESVLAVDTTKSQHQRSLNLFYVACSRPTQRLVVLAQSDLSEAALAGADHLFGSTSVYSTKDLPANGIYA